MLKKLSLLLCTMLLLTSTAFASNWQAIGQNDGPQPAACIDTDSIRYGDNNGKIDRNQISCYTKTTTADGSTIFACLRINRIAKTYEPLKTISISKDKSSISQMSSAGFAYPIQNDPSVKAVYDFLLPYCQKNDAAITANAGKTPRVDGLEIPPSTADAPADEESLPDIQPETV